MPILIVEDEPKTQAFLRQGLREQGFAVDTADNGEDGLRFVEARDYELILLDVLMPRLNGWAFLTELRRRRDDTPVIFLTARDSVEDRVCGLQLGADDYLIKPFAFSELLARIHSISRRSPARQPDRLSIADLEIDVGRHKVIRAHQRIELAPKQFSLLCLLARRSGEVLSRTLIAEAVWDMNFASDTNAVDVAIRRLRCKIDDNFPQKLIHTVRGVGYTLEVR
ncbi:MAG TPA: heavy metal response regulator transcription factor [Polyangiaceae bacterium]|nr:heavy metal response regulator transcription factor [Polyangiaceae bacterium]